MRLTKKTARTYKTIISTRQIEGYGYTDHSAAIHLSSWVDTCSYDLEFESIDDIQQMIAMLIELKASSFQNYKST